MRTKFNIYKISIKNDKGKANKNYKNEDQS